MNSLLIPPTIHYLSTLSSCFTTSILARWPPISCESSNNSILSILMFAWYEDQLLSNECYVVACAFGKRRHFENNHSPPKIYSASLAITHYQHRMMIFCFRPCYLQGSLVCSALENSPSPMNLNSATGKKSSAGLQPSYMKTTLARSQG